MKIRNSDEAKGIVKILTLVGRDTLVEKGATMHFFLQMTLTVGMMFLIDTSPLILGEEPPTELFSQQHEERIVLETIDRFVHYWNQDEAMKLSQMFMINGDFLSPSGMNAHSRKEIQRLITEERRRHFKKPH